MCLNESFLSHRNYRYLWVSIGLSVAGIVAYIAYEPIGGRHGGTWVGYSLGGLSAFLVVWLAWFGIKRRRYGAGPASTRGWLSAHVYLGSTLLILVPLHSAFQFGWNVHTLAFALLSLVVLSGFGGVLCYTRIPELVSRGRGQESADSVRERIRQLDDECSRLAEPLPNEVSDAVRRAVEETRIGGSLWRQLRGRDPSCPTEGAIAALETFHEKLDARDSIKSGAERLLEALSLKGVLVRRLRRDLRLRGWLGLWLVFHVPLSIATLAAVGVHVISVFYYW